MRNYIIKSKNYQDEQELSLYLSPCLGLTCVQQVRLNVPGIRYSSARGLC